MLTRVYFNKLNFPKDFATLVKSGKLKDRVREVYRTQQNLIPVSCGYELTQDTSGCSSGMMSSLLSASVISVPPAKEKTNKQTMA